MVFVTLASIIGFALALHCATKRGIALCLVAATAGVADLLYIAGLAGYLEAAAHALLLAGLAAGAVAVAMAAAAPRYRGALAAIVSPAPLVIIAGGVLYWMAYGGVTFHLWDEFSHWGLAAKELAVTNRFRTWETVTTFQDYPPGTAVFAYFFAANGGYSERVVYFSHYVLLATPLAVLLEGRGWKETHWVILTALTTLLLFGVQGNSSLSIYRVQGNSFLSIYVDPLLGAYFGAVLYASLTAEEGKGAIGLLIPALFLLPLIKKSGLFFAGVLLLVIAADGLIRSGVHARSVARTARQLGGQLWGFIVANRLVLPLALYAPVFVALVAYSQYEVAFACVPVIMAPALFRSRGGIARRLGELVKQPWSVTALLWCLLAAAPFAAKASWDRWVSANYLRLTFTTNFSTLDAAKVIVSGSSERAKVAKAALARHFLETPIGAPGPTVLTRLQADFPVAGSLGSPRLTAAGWTGIAIAMFLVGTVVTRASGARVRLAAATALVAAGLLAYLLGLFVYYYYSFDGSSGLRAESFERYVWSYLCGMCVAGWGLMARQGGAHGDAHKALPRAAVASCLAVSIFLYLFENPSWQIMPPASWAQAPAITSRIARQMDFIRSKTDFKDTVYVVFQDTSEVDRMAIRYELAPRHANSQYYALGRPECDAGPQRWKEMLIQGQYTYVYVGAVDAAFETTFGGFFEGGRSERDFLFRVFQDGRGGVKLAAVR